MTTPATAPLPQASLEKMPPNIFFVEMTYLILLIALFIAYGSSDTLRDALPALGPIPIQVAWFGATGGVLAGLGGIYYHNMGWNPAYNFWHYSRPLVGGIVGGIGSLLFYVSVSVGTKNPVVPNVLTFDAVAFILGFADDAFRDLIKRVTTLLFGPGTKGQSSTPNSAEPGTTGAEPTGTSAGSIT
jgi:hypothetical protein